MLQRCLKKITKLWSSNSKKRRRILLTVVVLCCLFGIIGLSYKNADGYTLGSKGSAIVPGTKSGNAEIWPITHPVFIVRLYDTKAGMGTEKNAYNTMAESIKTVIPYATDDALWLCSNKASSYLIDHKFKDDEEVYLARKTSLASTKLSLIGGEKNKDATGRIKYLSVNEYKEWGKDIQDGVFYGKLSKLYIKNNRSMVSLSKDDDFKKLLEEPDEKLKKYSMELWSYITEVNAEGSDSEGWNYKVDIKNRIDQFLHEEDAKEAKLDYNNWGETSTRELDGEDITIGDSFDLRYLDLLMTLNAISNNSGYWEKGINSFMLHNNGSANLSITQAIIARMNCVSTEDGDVKPATVFVSCNDLTQDAYKVKESYNLSVLESSRTINDEVKDTDYIKRLKAAVSLSKSKTYNSSSIYSSAIISRVISERVRSAENNKLVWGSSNNPLYLIRFLQMKFNKEAWPGVNWVLEPPITSSGVNYQGFLTVDSKDYNEIQKKNGENYSKENKNIDLTIYYEDKNIKQQATVITEDKVNLRLTLNALPLAGGKANDDWKTFIKKNNISTFRVRVELSRKEDGTDFKEVPLDNREFVQKHAPREEWCTSNKWQEITEDSLYTLLQGKTPIAQWEDETIEKMELEANTETKTKKDVIYRARVYIQYKASNGKWYYTTGKLDDTAKKDAVKGGTGEKNAEEILTNEVKLTYYWKVDKRLDNLDYPTANWASEEPALAYAELKEGSIYNETFEAMAGVPSTRTLYFSSGGNEFMVDLRVDYEHDATATREYISHYDGTECEYKTNDQLKGGTGTYTKDETFVGDSGGRTISKSVPAESSKIAEPEGNPSKNITVNGHTGETVLWARWDGSIGNGTGEPADSGKFDPGKPGSPCAGLGFDVGTLRTKEEPSTDWNVSKYNEALEQAVRWAQSMENTNSTYTVQKIADSDGQIRQYQVGNAVITITLEGGDNGYVHTTPRSYSGGAYTSSSALGAKLNSSDKKLGSGWGWSDGKLGSGGGYEAGNHGHGGVCPGNDHLVTEATKTSPAVYGPCGSVHNCGYYTPGTDITQGASGEIRYSIKVTFQNGTLKAVNYDGNGSDVSITTRTGLDRIPAHALCGPCCDHDLPAVEDVWYQDTVYDTIKITKCNVYKIQKGYITGMGEITNDSSENLVAGITHGDPNIFYNIAASNTPLYKDGKITNASGIGRIRYSLQEAQGDKVYYEEMSKGEKKRTNKCDGLCTMQDAQNPAPLAKKGHELGFAAGILYSNGKTSGYGSAPGLSITTEDFVSDNKATTPTPKTAYGNRLDSKDLLTDEWKRFYTRRTQEVTATVISDMLILQTSSGDQSPVYYTETTKAEAQKDFPSLQASGDAKVPSTQEQVDAKWKKMWNENGATFAKTLPNAINVGSYNGKYNLPTTKYQGSGKGERISTRFDQDSAVFASAKDELGLADVRSSQSFAKPSNDATNFSSPGKGQARMDRLSDLIICIDKIKQKPTNENREYETGESFLFYLPILKYKMPDPPQEIEDAFQEGESEVLEEAGYHYGAGLLYKSGYSAYGESVDDKVNNIVTLNAVSTQNAMIIKSKVEDQRTQGGVVKDAMETLKALEKCPGTPALCEYRQLSCKYTLDTTSLSFDFEDVISDGQVPEEKDIYSPFTGQLVTSSIKNTDGALPTYEVPEGMTVTAGDGVYAGFGTGQFLKITGAGTRLQFPYSDCKVYRTSSSRVSISADVYLPAQPKADTMLFSIGGVGLQVPANASSPVLLTSTGQRRAAAADIIGKKVKIVVTFSLGSLYDCELAVDGTKVLDSITDGLTDAQISAAAVGEEMRGSGVNVGCWEDNNSCATDFYVDNLVVTRCGGSLKHTASCYTTFKKEKSFYQDTYNGLRDGSSTIDWTREADDGKSYGVITSYSKHVHDSSCLTLDSRGYQIALAQAKAGDWTNLKKELGTTLFDKVVQSFGIDTAGGSAGDYKKGDVLTYQYTGGAQSVTLPKGRYKLEAYGAQGGNDSQIGGNGGYAQGTLSLSNTATLYLQAGGQGVSSTGGGGGYNGGGNAGNIGSSGGGGGASSIATVNGALSSILQNPTIKDSVLLVAGGGGGAGNNQTVTSDTPSTLTYTGNTSYTTREGSLAKSFTASGNGSVVFYSNDFTSDPYGFIYVYDSNGALRSSISNDDSGGALNFSCGATVYQGDTVVFYAGAYSREGSCNWTIQYTVSRTTITYAVGAGGTGGGAAGGNGGEVYLASYNGLGGSSASYYAFGQGGSHSGDGGGGGGGYYGGFAAKGDAGAGGGSGYTASRLTEASTSNGINGGNGRIVITVIEANRFPDENELFNYIKANMSLIPDTVTTGGKTITNPIWNCKLVNNAEKVYTEETLLTCTEPHHSGGHYDYSSDICWSACGRDENHKSTHQEVTDANGSKIEQAEYITLDNFFQIYFPNTGDFYGDGAYGISETSINRGKGYVQGMDTTEWTREKYVKFDFEVLYERNGVWENHSAGEWIPLEVIDRSTTRNYSLSGGTTLTLNGNTYMFDMARQLLTYNSRSTTLVEGGTMAVIDGKIFQWNGDGTVSVSDPCKEYNFYCLLSNNELSSTEVQYAVEGINYDGQSADETPYAGDGDYQEEFDIYRYGNTYNTNKQRFSDFTSNHTAAQLGYLDVVGRIGNFIVEDTDDMRFSNFFKKPVVETNDDWYIEGIISQVDSSISQNYLSWHRNSAGYPLALDVRGEPVGEKTGYYNTWGTQEWTAKAGSGSMGLSADKNNKKILQDEQLKLGYNVLFDITTMGDYNQYLQVIPYFYALDRKTSELIPVDVYISEDGSTKPINYFGLYSEYMDENGNYKDGYSELADNLYRYNMYLNWTNEAVRRNYKNGGLEAQVSDRVRDYFIEDIRGTDGEITGYKYLTVPYGNFYNMGTLQCLQPGRRARTFVGNSMVTAIQEQAARLGITADGINGGIETNLSDSVPEMFYRQAQRWHLTMGLPSSATFTAYREKGIHVKPEEEWYVADYVQDGIRKTKTFSGTYLASSAGEKSYGIGSTFTIAGVQYTISGKYNAGKEFSNNNDYVILMTADIKAIGDVWNLKYKTGDDNGNVTVGGRTYQFGSSIPTFIAAYDTVSSLVDISTQQTH